MPLDTVATKKFIDALNAYPSDVITRPEIAHIAEKANLPFPRWYCGTDSYRLEWGLYRKATYDEVIAEGIGYAIPGTRIRNPGISNYSAAVPTAAASEGSAVAPAAVDLQSLINAALGGNALAMASEAVPTVPPRFAGYVEWGHYNTVKTILESFHFLPFMVTGPSGNGKTEMIEQVCADIKREFIRVNITNQTDEDDLLGGFRLVNGETKYCLGPVPIAMITGAVLLIDEIDLGQAPMMCLQPVLEGKPLYLKKIGKYIYPHKTFTPCATSNTKGRGDDGLYAHTAIMNEAMLERFALMFEQGWPSPSVEKKILAYVLRQDNMYDAALVNNLVSFADSTRKLYEQQRINSQIATRRLLHIVRTFCTLKDINKVMELTLARFEKETATAMMSAWRALNDKATASASGSTI